MKDSIFVLLISAAAAEIISKLSKTNAPRMRTDNGMPFNDPVNHTEHASLEFKHTYCVPFIKA